jgi:hypothetical protein
MVIDMRVEGMRDSMQEGGMVVVTEGDPRTHDTIKEGFQGLEARAVTEETAIIAEIGLTHRRAADQALHIHQLPHLPHQRAEAVGEEAQAALVCHQEAPKVQAAPEDDEEQLFN